MARPFVISCLLLLLLYICAGELPIKVFKDVEIDSGIVRGRLARDGEYYAFLGIPYAAPPVGTRRFKAPQPPIPWDIFIANRTVKCPQTGDGDEDCLVVNVFTPTRLFNGPLPVLVYIHGGSFLIGAGQTRGMEPLIKKNVIVVTLNYRLGALGFLCLGIDEAPGNMGLKDQVAALKWVKRNIEQFGGDPNQVTVYGMSAGGTSVELLILSKMTKGLFKKAIIESGAATAVWSVDANPIKTAMGFADSFLDFPKKTRNLYRQVDYFRKIPANELSTANYKYYQNLTDNTFGFVPCVERKLYGVDAFLTNMPYNILRKGKQRNIPIMYIFANVEGLFLRSSDYYELNYKDKMNRDFAAFMPADLIFDTDEIRKEVAENVRRFYFGDAAVDDSTLMSYFNYFGDLLVLNGLLNSAVANSKNNNTVYMLEFAYKGRLGSYDKFYENIKMAGHGDAVKYTILNRSAKDKYDKLIVDRMTRIVANFAKYTDPSPNRTELLPILWPAVQPDYIPYLRLDKQLQVFEEPYWERKIFWDKLYAGYRREIKTVDPELLGI